MPVSALYRALAAILAFMDPKNNYNGDLLQTCIYTRLPCTNSHDLSTTTPMT